VVRNGIDLEAARAVAPETRERPFVFALGRFVPQKGFDVLIDAFAKVADEFSGHDLVLAGDGPERDALHARAAGQRVHFVGPVSPERALALHRAAAAFVLPSRHEPQGIVVIEAMAAGTPVLATRVGGVPETVVDGVNGLLVAGDDVGALADGLRRVLGDPAAAAARAARASQDVESYAWPRIADQYEQCYADAARLRGTS
jgi:glycosyltransferase involved in cell wall biosynthesis